MSTSPISSATLAPFFHGVNNFGNDRFITPEGAGPVNQSKR
ncbi:PhoH family protein, partial [Enterobacter cloacae]